MSLKAGVLGTLNQEDPDFKTLLSYKRTLSEKGKGGGVDGWLKERLGEDRGETEIRM